MRRRQFILSFAAAAISEGWSREGNTQPATTQNIGYLSSRFAEADAPFLAAFLRGLNEGGLGRSKIEFRWADNQPVRLEALAADLVARKPAVILAGGGSATALALQKLTSTIPVVFVNGADPVRSGLEPKQAWRKYHRRKLLSDSDRRKAPRITAGVYSRRKKNCCSGEPSKSRLRAYAKRS